MILACSPSSFYIALTHNITTTTSAAMIFPLFWMSRAPFEGGLEVSQEGLQQLCSPDEVQRSLDYKWDAHEFMKPGRNRAKMLFSFLQQISKGMKVSLRSSIGGKYPLRETYLWCWETGWFSPQMSEFLLDPEWIPRNRSWLHSEDKVKRKNLSRKCWDLDSVEKS